MHLDKIDSLLTNQKTEIEQWLEEKWSGLTPPLYLSCDVRNAGYKVGVVDTNIFPGGFNNLCKSYSKETSLAFKQYLQTYQPKVKKILLLGEAHTRNKYYLKNLHHLKTLLSDAGYEVIVGMPGEPFPDDKFDFDLDGQQLHITKIAKPGDLDGIAPDLIISNNDFSGGIPESIAQSSIPMIPPAHLGWHQRTKGTHFRIADELISDFGKSFDIDPWLLSPLTEKIPDFSFDQPDTVKVAATAIDEFLGKIKAKHQQYSIDQIPYLFLKNDAGTYGLGVMTLSSGDELIQMSRRQKNKLLSSKGGQNRGGFIVQEGIPTIDTYSEFPIEPVIYAIGKNDIGGFFRIHETKNEFESLNAPGMTFSCLCLHKLDEPHEGYYLKCNQKESVVRLARFLTKIAALAAAKEAKNIQI